MIEAMKEHMINPHIIDLVAKIYSDDSTVVTYGEIEEEMDINSGVKQGCTASTILFKGTFSHRTKNSLFLKLANFPSSTFLRTL